MNSPGPETPQPGLPPGAVGVDQMWQPEPEPKARYAFLDATLGFPKFLFSHLVGILFAVMTEIEITMYVAGVAILAVFVLPWEVAVGGGLILYTLIRTAVLLSNRLATGVVEAGRAIQDGTAHTGNILRDNLWQHEIGVAVKQLPEVLVRQGYEPWPSKEVIDLLEDGPPTDEHPDDPEEPAG